MAKKQISFRLDLITCGQLATLAVDTEQSQAEIIEQLVALATEIRDSTGQPDVQQRTAYACERYASQLRARLSRYAAP